MFRVHLKQLVLEQDSKCYETKIFVVQQAHGNFKLPIQILEFIRICYPCTENFDNLIFGLFCFDCSYFWCNKITTFSLV